ncbi:1-(5-phosphoribosyl)-5-[(5-phosphoribosylamino)methylideneamino]imidazole-4-carboxamide isomerase [Hazenella coriacea]|uniref:1-(5-phosphoribosyl)-5-[(5-phosphoribosylamino)methylideneamino] imidazole-4-carboxamide isomerase n=1 Tax=Hazenella coriacea TaxID=1179467 RepID=A0A4R3L7U5_9BACL|nr:1-(5-phosphoribosyl)-5-[(5-phosphoribosylamino)methylideneamino]imidazole-4-carboxamide isomerase [Hazenella coriacea]TCS95699.1 1-(5-phosphoribosyl)-5-[(5-phosphoribosylamino)methylideneamino] imidazole-4-carboxamide isomerase [Hazenella coriacea]
MGFTIYPAIDLRNGKCVRLTQGDYQQETIYSDDPVRVAEEWIQAGAEWIHVVDLDAARSGELVNLPVIQQMVQACEAKIQVGGGVRDFERLELLLQSGVERVIIGSAAIDDVEFVREALGKYRGQIAIGLDAREGLVATHGWLHTSQVPVEELALKMVEFGAEVFIFTDISRDGMLSGVNIQAVKQVAQICGKTVIASGGVRSLDDIRQLARDGISGAIVGKALYTHTIQLNEALSMVKEGDHY